MRPKFRSSETRGKNFRSAVRTLSTRVGGPSGKSLAAIDPDASNTIIASDMHVALPSRDVAAHVNMVNAAIAADAIFNMRRPIGEIEPRGAY
ncbi:MAG TPA: hypothetical protein PKE16_04835 [Hyphomicrobium sp.]|nr:hypothetical protein [Hyphomicrobium sp.]